jgi:hypothetical protein
MTSLRLTLVLSMLLLGCTVEVEDPGSLPDVDVSGGELPEVDIDVPEVEITTDTQIVEVPDIDIGSDEP